MKRYLALFMAIAIAATAAGCSSEPTASGSGAASTAPAVSTAPAASTAGNSKMKLAWYAPAPHAYFSEVEKGVQQFSKDTGIDVMIQIGPDWTQASENEKVEAMVAEGITGLSIYPCDASGANGLYDEISASKGVNVVNFGTDTASPSKAKFAIATDVKQAAYDAAVAVIKLMGEKGNLVNVLEVLEDPNTVKRQEGVAEAVAKYPNVKLLQEVAGIKTQEEAVGKIESVLSAHVGQVDGMVCTGQVSTSGMLQVLSDYYQKQGTAHRIHAVGIDTDTAVLDGIKSGIIDATMAQNTTGHGYISCMMLKYMQEGYVPKDGGYFINTGNVLVTKDNIDTFASDLDKVTKQILGRLTTDYLVKK